MFPTETVAMHLVFHNKIPNAFHAQLCQATESVQVGFPTLAVQIRICPVALPEKPQKIFSGDRGYLSADEKALGVAGEFLGNLHRILEELDRLDHLL